MAFTSSLARSLASAKTRAAVVSLAAHDPRLTATADQWDADPMLLGTPGGTVDLKTGVLRPADPLDYITKITAVAPGGDCPIWRDQFLPKITGGDDELQSYIKRVLGYDLTGLTVEQALFFLYGPGGNGKGVLMGTVADILGDYHKSAPTTTFTATKNEQHPTDLASLRGARMVSGTETEEGQQWAEAKIKKLTGDDLVPARFMRQNFFEYKPQFKFMISGNHKPSLRSVDQAIRRRFQLIPFEVVIAEHEKDKHLKDKLKAEWPGILAWMIEGCLEWQSKGLAPPERVLLATNDYLAEQDTFTAWLDDCCEVQAGDAYWTLTGDLFEAWSKWAQRRGVVVGSIQTFSEALSKARGQFTKHRKKDIGWGWYGLRIAQEPPPY